ncbi:hypothetical protein ACLVWU_11295 [Bdellovibrio sp. HCB290]|uniref:hypothetical protein n=1 Tax=Bdellovibrio sp. HCB290 TaxID=3394356 RepID=UPI0039B59B4D
MRFLMTTVASLFISASAFAWIPPYQYQINGYQAAVTMYNQSGYTVYCQGYAVGQLQNGMVVNSWFADWVGPFQYRTAFVYANPPFFFVNAWLNVNCQ